MNSKKQWYKSGKKLAMEMQTTQLSDDELALWYLGQCGFAFKKNNGLVLIDPVLNDLMDAQGNTRRMYPYGIESKHLHADLVLLTHAHRDHMSLPTITGLLHCNPDLIVVAPDGCRAALEEAGIPAKNIISLHYNQSIHPLNLDIRAIRTAHPEWELEKGELERSLAYEIEAGDIRIVHLGDTYMCKQLQRDLEDMEDVSIFLPPINGSDYFRTSRGCIGNLNPLEAAMAAKMVRADLSIPTHYDMMSGNTCSPLPFLEQMEVIWPSGKCALPRLGERIIYKR